MKRILSAILLLVLVFSAQAQGTKDYRNLLKDLNKMLRSAEEYVSLYGTDFEIVQPFKIEGDDRLSLIIKGKTKDTYITHKYEAQLNNINDFICDISYVLTFKSNSVIVSELKDGQWIAFDKRHVLILGKRDQKKPDRWSSKLRADFNELFPGLKNEYEWMD